MKTNKPDRTFVPLTHEGARASIITPAQELRRTVMACMLWEDNFYESGVSVAERIYNLVPACDPLDVRDIAIEARNKMHLRHVPLLIVREMARHPQYRRFVSQTLYDVIQRADEPAEFLSLYWNTAVFMNGQFFYKKTPVAKQIKLGLGRALEKFNAYQLAKYNREAPVTLRDVLNICHPTPPTPEHSILWKQVLDGTLPTPDTWEVALSSGADKLETWTRLIRERKLGGMAILRNLRNMVKAGVQTPLIYQAIQGMNTERILPFRFIAAANAVPNLESVIEPKMLECISDIPKMDGKTILLIDVSGSMNSDISGKSEMTRMDAAAGLAILAREVFSDVDIYTFSASTVEVQPRHGFALRDAIFHSQNHGVTRLGAAMDFLKAKYRKEEYLRIVIITDEQSHDNVLGKFCNSGYIINVGCYKNGVGYGDWTHIDGWSEAVLDYIRQVESE